jgi:Domain of unknown function (DUF4263)
MISFEKKDSLIIISYSTDRDNKWVFDKFDNGESYAFNKVYNLSSNNFYGELKPKEIDKDKLSIYDLEPEPIDFIFARLIDEYYKVEKGILINKFDIYFHKDFEFDNKVFIAEGDISIFRKIEQLINEDIYIGGNNSNAIAEIDFIGIINDFPSQYEKKLYSEARLTNVIKEFFSSTINAEKKFEKYIDKKATNKGQNLTKLFSDIELFKYQTILKKLEGMLFSEVSYSENQWQDEILQIILLLYPKYFLVFKEAPIKAKYDKEKNIREEKFIDILLVDSDGNIDLIEIKKPSNSSLMTKGQYRNNHIPLRELSGTVMQIEKYIYYLNRWGENGEEELTKKYKAEIPEGFEINITNPKGFIIMGRENDLSIEQKKDFEVVKRKYKNVIDIISYDDLLNRLKFTIEQIKKN